MNDLAVCFIAGQDYYPYFRLILDSVRLNLSHPADFFHYYWDELPLPQTEGVTTLEALEVMPNCREMQDRYGQLAPAGIGRVHLVNYLLEKGYQKVLYFDCDMDVYHSLDPLVEMLDESVFLLTPHNLQPLPNDELHPSNEDIVRAGQYNSGFFAVRNTPEVKELMQWWKLMSEERGAVKPFLGQVAEQGWMRFIPSFLDSCKIIRRTGYNVSYLSILQQNLHRQEGVWQTTDGPLVIFHFSGLTEDLRTMSKHQTRYTLSENSPEYQLYKEYTEKLSDYKQRFLVNRMQSELVSIIMVTYNSMSTLDACLNSVFAHTRTPFEVVVVDNASTDETKRYLAGRLDITTILNRENVGFSRATNQGLQAGKGEYSILLNPDTQVTAGWLDRLLSHFAPDVGAVGPISNYVAGLQRMDLHMEPLGEVTLEALAQHLAKRNAGKSVETKLLIGFCIALRKEVIERLGGLDDDLFLGNDDLEYSHRLRRNSYRLLVATDSFVYHHGQVSFATKEKTETDRLVQQSTDTLYRKLEQIYGLGQVPSALELWGIDWFKPTALKEVSSDEGLVTSLPDQVIEPQQINSKTRMVSIVILAHNQLDFTKLCIESIRKNTSGSYELILVDNGSTDGTTEYFQSLPDAKVIINQENKGFPTGCNQGIEVSEGNYVLLLNNDVIVTEGWLDRLVACAESDSQIGLVGPRSNYVSGPQQIPAFYETGDELQQFARQLAARGPAAWEDMDRLVGFCLLIKKEVLAKIGGMDERFGTGNFEDDDLCLRARQADYRLVCAGDVFIHHFGSRTFLGAGIDYAASIQENLQKFTDKWKDQAEPTPQQIASLMAADRVDEAFELISRTHGKFRGYARVFHELGMQQLSREDIPAAERRFRQAASIDPKDSVAHNSLAYTLFRLQRLEEAEVSARRALEIDSNYAEGYNNLGMILKFLGRQMEALTSMTRAIELKPSYPEAIKNVSDLVKELSAPPKSPKKGKKKKQAQAVHNEELLTRLIHARTVMAQASKVEAIPPDRPPKLSLCMIVKNEETYLTRCLESVHDVVDEIIVVDTGSTDRTQEIAQSFGAKTYSHLWKDDYGEARNASLSHATGDWILYLDADEVLDENTRKRLRQAVAVKEADCYLVPLHNHLQGASSEELIMHYAGRLFRNLPGVKFRGRIHEEVVPFFNENKRNVVFGELLIHHYGYSPDLMESRNKLERTYDLLRKEIEDDPTNAFQHYNMANTLQVEGRLEEAIEWFEKAEALVSTDTFYAQSLYNSWATCLHLLGRLEESLAIVDKVLEIRPDHPEPYFVRGLNFRALGRHDEAIANLQACIDLGKKFTVGIGDLSIFGFKAYQTLGESYMAKRNYAEAIRCFRKTLEMNPSHVNAHFDLAVVLKEDHQLEEAERECQETVRLDANHSGARTELAIYRLNRGDVEGAMQEYRELVRLLPGSATAHCQLANCYSALAQNEKALSEYLLALQLEPNSPDLHSNLGNTYGRLGRIEEAESELREALRLSPNFAEAYNNLGVLQFKQLNWKDARPSFQRAVELHPNYTNAWTNLGQTLFNQEDLDAAIEAFEKALSLTPNSTDLLINIAACYEKKGVPEAAQLALQRAVELDPSLAAQLSGEE